MKDIGKKVLCIAFLIMMVYVGIMSKPYVTFGNVLTMLKQEWISADGQADAVTIESISKGHADSVWKKDALINLNGSVAKALNVKGYYGDSGIYVADGKYIVKPYAETSTDYEYEQIVEFKTWLDEKGIDLLYVNAPLKYLDDSFMEEEFGIKSYGNRNVDLFLKRIEGAGINYLDLRDEIIAEGLDIKECFYRTDHHWTTECGLMATGKIAKALNRTCGYDIDVNIYDKDNYIFTEYKNCWLGEQGRKVAVSYVGLDDFTLINPKFDTSFTLSLQDSVSEGNFDILVNEAYLNTEVDVYAAPSWHYSYIPVMNGSSIHNNNVEKGKILVLGDSYSQVMTPFLALSVSEVDTLILRAWNGNLKEHIEANDYDAVVICYAGFMIGAHDDPNNANTNMFTFN